MCNDEIRWSAVSAMALGNISVPPKSRGTAKKFYGFLYCGKRETWLQMDSRVILVSSQIFGFKNMDFTDQEVLVGTTSQDLFSEIMDRTPVLKGYFEAFLNERCNRPHPSCSEAGCETGPNAKTYCFMRFFHSLMRGNPNDVEPFLALVQKTPTGPSHAYNVAKSFVASKQEEIVKIDDDKYIVGTEQSDIMSTIKRILGGKIGL